MAEEKKVNKKLTSPKILLSVITAIIILGLIAVSAYFYLQYKKSQDLLKNPTLAAQVESQALIDKVGKLIDLPNDEQPTIATVSDVNKLKNQPFFANAKNGFKVLIYPKAQKAILYDPIANKIVEVGPVNLGTQSTTPSKSAPVKISLYNGTTVVGLTSKTENDLKDKGFSVDVVEKANASTSAYTKTLVIDLGGKQTSLVNQLAAFLNGQVAKLPDGEKKPQDAEILVILGK